MSFGHSVNDRPSMRRNHRRLCRNDAKRSGEDIVGGGAGVNTGSVSPSPLAGQTSFVFSVGGWKSDRYTAPDEERPPILRRTNGDQQTDKDTDNEWDADRLWANSTREITPTTWPLGQFIITQHLVRSHSPKAIGRPPVPWAGGRRDDPWTILSPKISKRTLITKRSLCPWKIPRLLLSWIWAIV